MYSQHLFNQRPVETVVIILADSLDAMQLQPVFMAQKSPHDNRLLEVARQPIKLPDHQRVKLALLGGFLHTREPVPVQTPTMFSPIHEHAHDHALARSDRFATYGFLVFQADFILHFRGIAGVDRKTHTLMT
ncbi:MAG: hypothetical protein K8S97_13045 [Anaerolineae bacterium]|nr:hypothetical protein [Anaerolineae bacterium]